MSHLCRTCVLEEGAAVLVALGMDLLGEPPAACHPVVWYGKLIQRLEQHAPQSPVAQLLYGMLMLLLAAPLVLLPTMVIHRLARWMRARARQCGYIYSGSLLYALVEGISLKPFFP